MRSDTPSGPVTQEGRRLDSHQHEPVYKTGAFLFRATSAEKVEGRELRVEGQNTMTLALNSQPSALNHSSTSARIRTPSGGFGDRLLSQEHTRV